MTSVYKEAVQFFLLLLSVLGYTGAQSQNICKTPNNVEGRCIPVKNCQPIVDFLSNVPKPIPTNIVQQLVNYTCGYENSSALVCCPPDALSFEETEDLENADDITKHEKIRLIPEDCGLFDMGDRIRNGQNAEIREFPWMAALAYNTRKGKEFNCGGSIINDRYILTAAHCVVGTPAPLIGVRIGEYDTSSDVDCQDNICLPPVQDLTIEKIMYHPDYNKTLYANDIGLIRVSKMNLTVDNAKPVCLPIRKDIRDMKFTLGIVIGWGFTNQMGRRASILQKVALPIHNLTTCIKAYEKLPQVKLTEKQLCAGGVDNKDSCGGDSGGPLHSAAYFDNDNRYVQRGIVSVGHAYCGLEGYPSVFTRVAPYLTWILDSIEP